MRRETYTCDGCKLSIDKMHATFLELKTWGWIGRGQHEFHFCNRDCLGTWHEQTRGYREGHPLWTTATEGGG
jgi:hypothetical protein